MEHVPSYARIRLFRILVSLFCGAIAAVMLRVILAAKYQATFAVSPAAFGVTAAAFIVVSLLVYFLIRPPHTSDVAAAKVQVAKIAEHLGALQEKR